MFDPEFYLQEYPDVADAGTVPLLHYLEAGRFERRQASATFDPSLYLAANPKVASSGLEPFLHYVLVGQAAGLPRSKLEALCRNIGCDFETIDTLDELGLSISALNAAAQDIEFLASYRKIEKSGLFDAKFYRDCVPSARGMDPLAHYSIWGKAAFLDPSSSFSAIEYHLLNPDVTTNALLHYITAGRLERRLTRLAAREELTAQAGEIPLYPSPEESVAAEVMRGQAYLCRFGFTLEKDSSLKYLDDAIDDLAERSPLLQIDESVPDVSIIIPVHGQIPVLLNCLDSLARHTSRYRAEIIIADDASPAESKMQRLDQIPWIRVVRNSANKGFLETCNHCAAYARGRYFVFLNNDTRLAKGWLDELISAFESFPKAGLIGSKLMHADRSLQEAGGIVWRNGEVWNYGRDDYPWRPEYCYARQVDYCSGAAIAVPATIWQELGGFDEYFKPAYCEDTDLAFRLRRARYEVWLQPLSLVIHYEGKSHGKDLTSNTKAYQVENLKKFYQRWRGTLGDNGYSGQFPIRECNRTKKQRILVIDALTPMIDRDSGSINTFEVLRLFLSMGWHVSFVPRNFQFVGSYTAMLQRMGVEVLLPGAVCNLQDILDTRPEFYDVIFAFRVETLRDWYAPLRDAYPSARIVFHDIDLHYLRLQREAELLSQPSLRIRAEIIQDQELDLFTKVDCSVVVTEAEKAIIEDQVALNNIVVYPYTINVQKSERSFLDRNDICFVGGYAHYPNVDAVIYFVQEIWPRVRKKLPANTKFLIIGPGAPEKVQQLASNSVVVTGHIPDLDEAMSHCRISVAPLRYGAGIKGKLVRSLAVGLPAVASTIAVEGMGLTHEKHLLVADKPVDFARAILRLYNDEDLWRNIQHAGYEFVEQSYSWKEGLDTCKRILKVADETWIARRRADRKMRLSKLEKTSDHADHTNLERVHQGTDRRK